MSLLSFALAVFLCAVVSAAPHDLLCRKCGYSITRHTEVLNLGASPEAKYTYEFPVLGRNTTINVFKNPAGETFHVLPTKTANLRYTGQTSGDATWFPGKQWTICVCSKCGQHMGWFFTPRGSDMTVKPPSDSFVGIVLDYVISSDYVDSLTGIPR